MQERAEEKKQEKIQQRPVTRRLKVRPLQATARKTDIEEAQQRKLEPRLHSLSQEFIGLRSYINNREADVRLLDRWY